MFVLSWYPDEWFENEWFPDFSVLETAFFGGGPERADTVPGRPPSRARVHHWHDVELEQDVELWYEERRKYGRIYIEPVVVLEPEVVEEVRPTFVPYEPPPVKDDTAERLALAAQRAQEAVDRLVAEANERARISAEAALRKIEDAEAMKAVAAAIAVMESEN